MKDLIIKMFRIKTYEEENAKLKDALEKSTRSQEKILESNKQIALYVIRLEDELEDIKHDPEMYIEEQVERRMLEYEKEHKDEMNHKWYNAGRYDAYADMGIRNIEAHERGNQLIRTPDGEIVELILGLEDVTGKTYSHEEAWDEIKIDDLITE